MLGGGHRIDQALHEIDVHAPKRPQRQVHDLAPARHLLVHVEGSFRGADGRFQPVPGGAEWLGALVVGHLRIQVQIQPRRARVELIGRARRDADGCPKVIVLGEQVFVYPVVLVSEGTPSAAVGNRQARQGWRELRVAHLKRVCRDEPGPRGPGQLDGREPGDIVGAHDVGAHFVPDLHEAVVRVLLTSHQGLPNGLGDGGLLLDRRPSKLRRRDPDELRPRVRGGIGVLLGRCHAHHLLLEPASLKLPSEGFVHHEHDPVPTPAKDFSDGHAIVRGAPRTRLGEEYDRLRVAHVLGTPGQDPKVAPLT